MALKKSQLHSSLWRSCDELRGGIPDRDLDALGAGWEVFPSLREALFEHVPGRRGYRRPRVEARQVKAAILDHEEFRTFEARVAAVFDAWCEAHRPRLRALDADASPGRLIRDLSEDLLARFADLPLLDRYDVYQCLMDWWDEAMQDDVHLVAAEGWREAARPRGIIEDRERNVRETPDPTIGRRKYKMDLIPPALIEARCFAAERASVEALRAEHEAAAREAEEFVEEHGGEGGLLEDAADGKGRVARAGVERLRSAMAADRYEAVFGSASDARTPRSGARGADGGVPEGRPRTIQEALAGDEDWEALTRGLRLFTARDEAGKAVKAAQAALDEQVLGRYAALTEAEIRTLVVEDKWFARLRDAVHGEVERLTQGLAGRVKALEERYARPLPELEREVEAFGAKVEGHLRRMGLSP